MGPQNVHHAGNAWQIFWATDVETGEVLKYPARHSKAGKPLFRRRFIPAQLKDNPYLYESGDYEAMLLSLPETQRRQLLEGNWDIAEGAAFVEFDRSTHVVEPTTCHITGASSGQQTMATAHTVQCCGLR